MQLTFFNGNTVGSPHWSPDSRQIVFDARPSGSADIYVVNADGGKPRPLISGPTHDVMPSWSSDGRWVYFCSNRSGDFQVWKVPADGGQAVQVTQGGGFEAFESPDGQLVYYTRERGATAIWQASVTGGEEKQVSDQVVTGFWRYWGVRDDGIYFVPSPASGRPVIMFFSFDTRRVSRLGTIERNLLQWPGLTISPDGRWILSAEANQSISDIMLFENFR